MDFTKYFSKIRQAESGGNPNAENPHGASGLYQFVETTWKGLGYDWKDRFNPELQQEAAQRYTEETYKSLNKFVQGEVTDADLYGAHFLGAAGYRRLYKADPNTPITDIMSEKEIAQNQSVVRNKDGSYKTAQGIKDWLKSKMGQTADTESYSYTIPKTEYTFPRESMEQIAPRPGGLESAKILEDTPKENHRENLINYVEKEKSEQTLLNNSLNTVQQLQSTPSYLEDENLFQFYG